MRLFGRSHRPRQMTRLFFATDLHGSTRTFKKLLSAAHVYNADVLIMGGDVSGKILVPIVAAGDGSYDVTLHGVHRRVREGDELLHVIEAAETQGQYHAILSPGEYEHLRGDEATRDALFHRLVRERLRQWRALADERLGPAGKKCFVTGGNDDTAEDVAVLEDDGDDSALVFCEGRVVMVDEYHPMISCGWSNPTPWNTPRETSEAELARKLDACLDGLDDRRSAIFNIHPPPHDSTLDLCPALDASTDPPTPIFSGGQPVITAAGSTAVRELIQREQPLLGLHGHIHESRGAFEIARTVVINPGSEYGEGFLRGCLVNLAEDRIVSFQMTSG